MVTRQTERARNNSGATDTRAALNFEMPTAAPVPEWIMLLPAGPEISGRDGRAWRLDDPQAVVEMFAAQGLDLPVDIEHATEIKGPNGEPAPAVGWVKALEARDGQVWGRVEWTTEGGFAVGDRRYRYISPVFIYDKTSKQILRLTSVALTNQPNLAVQALNREEQTQHEEEPAMKKIYAALGLAETATEQEALNAIEKMRGDLATATNRAESPSLDKFVPRADHDAALARAGNAEKKLGEMQAAQLEKEIETEVGDALKAGKITPATADYHKAQCRQEGGLDRFRDFVKAAPVIGDASGLDGKSPDDGGKAMNAEDAKVAAMFGNSIDDIKKYGNQ
ncbi:MAG: phage protease [Thermodesulfobacteriota bacterium]